MIKLIIVGILLVLVTGLPKPKETICGYQACHPTKPEMINVHLIPHTHDDVGWIKTVDQYLYGSGWSNSGVQYILDSVIAELLEDPARRFIYVETGFFWPWWIEQDNTVKEQVKQLVAEGRLEFIGGAWSMQDEGATYYQSNIDQYTWGLRKLNDTFGVCGVPRVGWMIDPFGQSKETASMFAGFGFDAFFVNRIDYQDKKHRLDTKTMEFIWEGSNVLGDAADIFTSTLYRHYSHPAGFCFDYTCNDDAIIDNSKSPYYNADKKSEDFIDFAKTQASFYNTNHILVPMGDDFHFQNANQNFKNMDKLIRLVNERQQNGSNVNVLYSTPSCYAKNVNDANLTYGIKTDDFFPYGISSHNYFTGYFASRPSLKFLERFSNRFLQVCKQLSALSQLQPGSDDSIDSLREAMGVLQHHDAITGTEWNHVAADYARLLTVGIDKCSETTSRALMSLTDPTGLQPSLEFRQCLLLNISQCDVTSGQNNFIVTVYNPLSKLESPYIRVPVTDGTYSVYGPDGWIHPSEVIPLPKALRNIPGRTSTTTNELVFRAESILPLGFKNFYVQRKSSELTSKKMEKAPKADITIGGTDMTVIVDEQSGLLKKITVLNKTVNVEQNFWYYVGAVDNVQNSDSYTLRPETNESTRFADKAQIEVVRGELVEEIHQTFSEGVSQVIRHYKGERHVELEFLVGPIPINDGKGKEVLSKFSTDLNTKTLFYDDSNGRQSMQRSRIPPEWAPEQLEPVGSNYYPASNWAYLGDVDDGRKLVVVTDRSQGCSSLQDGDLEMMVHRRLLFPPFIDNGLNETAYGTGLVVRGKHLVTAGDVSESDIRKLSLKNTLNPWVFLSDAQHIDENVWIGHYVNSWAGTWILPEEVNILTLEPWRDSTVLLRLENVMQSGNAVSIELDKVFNGFDVISARETNLAANQWMEDMQRLKWTKQGSVNNFDLKKSTKAQTVFINPQEIRTIVVEIKPKIN